MNRIATITAAAVMATVGTAQAQEWDPNVAFFNMASVMAMDEMCDEVTITDTMHMVIEFVLRRAAGSGLTEAEARAEADNAAVRVKTLLNAAEAEGISCQWAAVAMEIDLGLSVDIFTYPQPDSGT